jgi:hypothetical protein
MLDFLNSVVDVLIGLVLLSVSVYLLVTGVRGLQRQHIRLEWRITIDLVGMQAVVLGICFSICGAVGGIAVLFAAAQLIFANVVMADPMVRNAIVVWGFVTSTAGIVAYGTPLYNMYRDSSALSKLVWVGVLMVGSCVGVAAWLWLKANP